MAHFNFIIINPRHTAKTQLWLHTQFGTKEVLTPAVWDETVWYFVHTRDACKYPQSSAESGTTQGFGLQTANKVEDEARWETCLQRLQFIVALRWCVEDICEQHVSSIHLHALCNFRDACNHHLGSFPSSASMYWLQRNCQRTVYCDSHLLSLFGHSVPEGHTSIPGSVFNKDPPQIVNSLNLI